MLDVDDDAVAAPQDWPSRHIATLVLNLSVTISSYFFPLKNKANVKVTTSNGKNFLFFIIVLIVIARKFYIFYF
jgi:hypothetical protein